MSIGELWAPSSPPGAASAIEVVEGGPSPTDTNGVEALGGFSMKLGSLPSTTGSATAKGVAWTGGVGAGERAVLELGERAVLVLGERAVKKVCHPFSFGDKAVLSRLIILILILLNHLRGFPLWFPQDELFSLRGGQCLWRSWTLRRRSALGSGDLHHRVGHGLGPRRQLMSSGERPQFS